MKHKKGEYQALQGSLWENVFHLYELTDIVRQSNNPEFADILVRVGEGKHASTDIKKKFEALEDTYTSTWRELCVSVLVCKCALTNYLAEKGSTHAVEELNIKEFIIRAED